MPLRRSHPMMRCALKGCGKYADWVCSILPGGSEGILLCEAHTVEWEKSMTEDEKTDLWCVGRVNGLGDKCPEGSYVGLIYSGGGTRTHIRVSTGHAENLIAEMQAALKPAPEKPKPFPPGTKISTTPPVQ